MRGSRMNSLIFFVYSSSFFCCASTGRAGAISAAAASAAPKMRCITALLRDILPPFLIRTSGGCFGHDCTAGRTAAPRDTHQRGARLTSATKPLLRELDHVVVAVDPALVERLELIHHRGEDRRPAHAAASAGSGASPEAPALEH